MTFIRMRSMRWPVLSCRLKIHACCAATTSNCLRPQKGSRPDFRGFSIWRSTLRTMSTNATHIYIQTADTKNKTEHRKRHGTMNEILSESEKNEQEKWKKNNHIDSNGNRSTRTEWNKLLIRYLRCALR